MRLSGAKASDGRFVLLFEGLHDDCKHVKHVAKVLDYTFVFCKETLAPMVIYCGAEIVDNEDVLTLVMELADKYSLMSGVVESPFFSELSKSLLSLEGMTLTG
jgi:hypothetical protein